MRPCYPPPRPSPLPSSRDHFRLPAGGSLNGTATTFAVVISDCRPLSLRVLAQRAMETAAPPSPALNSARKLGLVVMFGNVSAAGSVGAG